MTDPLSIERDAALNAPLGRTIVTADGRRKMEYVASYELPNGDRQSIGFWAYSRDDAQKRVEWMRQSLTFEGVAAEFGPKPD